MSLFGAWALSLGAISVSAAPAAARPANTWVLLTALPEQMDSPVFAIAANPADPNTLLVGSSSGTIYRSTDAGTTWAVAGRGLGRGVVTIQYSPFKPGLVYAGTLGEGLWKSADSGATWARQANIPSTTVRSLGFAKSLTLVGADGGLFSSKDGNTWMPYLSFGPLSLSAIAVAAVNDPPQFLAGADATKGADALPLYVSQDGGTNWTNVKSLGSSTVIGAAAAGGVPPAGSSRAVVVGTNAGAFLSADGGQTWAQASGLPAIDFNSAAFVTDHYDRFYVASDGGGTQLGGVWSSVDSGVTFRSLSSPIGSVTALALTAEEAPTLYTATFRPIDHRVMLWSFHDTGGAPGPPVAGIPAVAGPTATVRVAARPAAAGFSLGRALTSPEAPYLVLGFLAVFVLVSAVVLHVRRGSE